MKRQLILMSALFCMLMGATAVQADLWTIGSANYDAGDHNLIYDTDQQLTFFDFTKARNFWPAQNTWAESLSLAVSLAAGYTSSNDWTTGWRLPIVDNPIYDPLTDVPQFSRFFHNSIHTDSEMGRLYFTALGNPHSPPIPNHEPFNSITDITDGAYWTGSHMVETGEPRPVWDFNLSDGEQFVAFDGLGGPEPQGNLIAMAVHPGLVEFRAPGPGPNPVPEPATILLLGAGLLGLAGIRRKYVK